MDDPFVRRMRIEKPPGALPPQHVSYVDQTGRPVMRPQARIPTVKYESVAEPSNSAFSLGRPVQIRPMTMREPIQAVIIFYLSRTFHISTLNPFEDLKSIFPELQNRRRRSRLRRRVCHHERQRNARSQARTRQLHTATLEPSSPSPTGSLFHFFFHFSHFRVFHFRL